MVGQEHLIDLFNIGKDAFIVAVNVDLAPGTSAGDKAAGSLVNLPGQTLGYDGLLTSALEADFLFARERLAVNISIDIQLK